MKPLVVIAAVALLVAGCGESEPDREMTLQEEAYYVGYHFGLADMCASSNTIDGPMPESYDDSMDDDMKLTNAFDSGYQRGYDSDLCD